MHDPSVVGPPPAGRRRRKGGRNPGAAALVLLLACTMVLHPEVPAAGKPGPTSTTKKLDAQRSRVTEIRNRINDLTTELTSLIRQLRSLDRKVEAASNGVVSASVGLEKAEERMAATKSILSARAREAYKRGAGLPQFALLLDVHSVGEMLSASRLMSEAIAADRVAFDQAVASAEAFAKRKEELTQRREELFASSARLEKVRARAAAALAEQQQILANAQAELAALEEERRREEERLSAGTAARRAARQILLDRKLETLLDWIRPSSGPAGFVPDGLRSTDVATTGLASWYGPGFDGRRASSGATYRQEQLTAASLVLPFGTFLKVTRGGRAVVVVITDRGPYVPGRVLDLSLGAARAIGMSGVTSVQMEILVPVESAPEFP